MRTNTFLPFSALQADNFIHRYGFHADDGRAFCCQGNGEPFGPTFTSGDVVGCGIDWTDAGPPRGERERNGSEGKDAALKGGARVFFTKNGEFLGAMPSCSQCPKVAN